MMPGRTLSHAKHWIERHLLAPLFRPLYRVSTAIEPHAELVNRFQQALLLGPGTNTATSSWTDFCATLQLDARSDDIGYFLHWPTVRKTMFGSDDPFIREEIRLLKRRHDWSQRWRPALREDAFGGPVPSRYYPLSSPTLIHHAHHLALLEDITGADIKTFDVVIEFGGGYGSLSRLVRRMGFKGTYVIYDLPPFSALQQLYLNGLGLTASALLPASAIEPGQTCLCSDLPTMLAWLDAELHGRPGGRRLFIATWSLSEAPVAIRQSFVSRLADFSAVLIAYQRSFDGIDNDGYFRQAEQGLPSWTFHHATVPGMEMAAGQYWIGTRPA